MNKITQHQITTWVAVLIIASIGGFFVYFIWASANESWGYDYVYPQVNKKVSRLLTQVETVGWKTYSDEGYGFQLRHPAKYSETVSTIVGNSVLGTSGNAVPGTSVGPLVFVKADSAKLQKLASAKFDYYWSYPGHLDSATNYCSKGVIDNTDLDIRVVSCLIAGKKANYALIKGKDYNVFVDGSSSGYDKKLIDAYGQAGNAVSKAEFVQILSTFEFLTPKT